MKADVNARALTMPECYKKAVIYQLFLRAFHPRGTLQAATGMLDELADLGVDIVYLCPIASPRPVGTDRKRTDHSVYRDQV